jgi:hypothetical protein
MRPYLLPALIIRYTLLPLLIIKLYFYYNNCRYKGSAIIAVFCLVFLTFLFTYFFPSVNELFVSFNIQINT